MGRSNYGLLLSLANERGEFFSVARGRSEVRVQALLYACAPFPITGSATLTHDNNTLDGLKIISTPQMQTEKLHSCVLAIIRLKMAQLEAYDLSFNTQLNFPHHAFNFCLSLLFGPYFWPLASYAYTAAVTLRLSTISTIELLRPPNCFELSSTGNNAKMRRATSMFSLWLGLLSLPLTQSRSVRNVKRDLTVITLDGWTSLGCWR